MQQYIYGHSKRGNVFDINLLLTVYYTYIELIMQFYSPVIYIHLIQLFFDS